MIGRAALLCSVAVVGAACRNAPPATDRTWARADLVVDLALLATGAPPTDHELQTAYDEAQAGLAVVDYIDRLLRDQRFARGVAAQVVLKQVFSSAIQWHVLRRADDDVLYLRAPCGPDEAERVAPWWEPDTWVRVCRDAYRPDRVRDPESGWYCGGQNLAPDVSDYCGCGPALVLCARDEEHSAALRRSVMAEVLDTLAYVVEHDRPLAELYTMSDTIRDGNVEILYRRAQFLFGKINNLPDPTDWTVSDKPTVRPSLWAGQHAGVLTSPYLIYMEDGPRMRLRRFYEILWGISEASQDVSTEQVLALGATDLRFGEGWKQLAALPVCTACHARLDYGVQFFAGYSNRYVTAYPIEQLHHGGQGPLYGVDIDDHRGDAALTARGFAALAVAQPEFAANIEMRVLEHVFGSRAPPEARTAVRAAFARKGTLRAAMRAALMVYAERRIAGDGPATPRLRLVSVEGDGSLVAGPKLRAFVDEHCADCHHGDDALLRAEAIDGATANAMASQVAFGIMPRGRLLHPAERTAFVDALVEARPSDERAAARWYLRDHESVPLHRFHAVRATVRARAGTPPDPTPLARGVIHLTEEAIEPADFQLSPGVALRVAVDAYQACTDAGGDRAARLACMERAVNTDALANRVAD